MRHPVLHLTLASVAVVFAVLPLAFWDGGLIERESTFFVHQYTDGRPVLQTIFDPHANDIGTYQARELSYFFDWIDAQVLIAAVSRGLVVLAPVSGVLAGVLTVVIFVV